eukprot:COSAG01_NODE_10381_length_2180_cov_111.494954_1_plen_34_part_10
MSRLYEHTVNDFLLKAVATCETLLFRQLYALDWT